jgi:hypothetical protein
MALDLVWASRLLFPFDKGGNIIGVVEVGFANADSRKALRPECPDSSRRGNAKVLRYLLCCHQTNHKVTQSCLASLMVSVAAPVHYSIQKSQKSTNKGLKT